MLLIQKEKKRDEESKMNDRINKIKIYRQGKRR